MKTKNLLFTLAASLLITCFSCKKSKEIVEPKEDQKTSLQNKLRSLDGKTLKITKYINFNQDGLSGVDALAANPCIADDEFVFPNNISQSSTLNVYVHNKCESFNEDIYTLKYPLEIKQLINIELDNPYYFYFIDPLFQYNVSGFFLESIDNNRLKLYSIYANGKRSTEITFIIQ